MRETETGDSGQERKTQLVEKQNAIWEKNVFVYARVMKKKKSQRGERRRRACRRKTKIAFALHWKISFRRHNEDYYQLMKPFECLCCKAASVLKSCVKKEGKKTRE